MSKTCRWIEARLHSFEQHPFLKTLHLALCIVALASFLLLIRALILNPEKGANCVWMNCEFLSACLYGCLTLWVISYNLMKFIDVEAAKAVGDLRIKLHDEDNMEIHKLLLASEEEGDSIIAKIMKRKNCPDATKSLSIADDTEDTEDNPQKSPVGNHVRPNENKKIDDALLFNYLGTIELGSIMLQKGIITFDEFFNQFGYRVQNIANCDEIMEHVRSDSNKDYYENLLYVVDEFHRHKMI